ncbi:MAG: hypothetical protein KIS66_13770 [Fimbriimonadaceae bacterium]|nr:hypothetical protein [Fimbriimonadaceae bacterium]
MKFAPYDEVIATRAFPDFGVSKGDVLVVIEPGVAVDGTVLYLCELPHGADSQSGVHGLPEDCLEKIAA